MRNLLLLLVIILVASCGGNTSQEQTEEPGSDKSAKTEALETGSELLQNKPPVDAIALYLNGFHFYNGDMKGQMEAHHYCTKLNEDVTQCVIYDGNQKDAHIMGIEYIISEKLFKTLPPEEKVLWHSHAYEVKSGTLVAPNIPQVAEHELMEQIVSTYGKTWHTWHTDLDKELPYGSPQLMMGFTKDGQLDTALVAKRDKQIGISTKEKRENRNDIPSPEKVSGADAWEQGKIVQLPPFGKKHHNH
ncbi:OBAP family protein [Chryseosolibacter indicus]|uniref:DUF1264 domain-containing protein n=1 Tax=Chryseosolibacter indicus TaxID=2782351 RepID=A0ABS5VRM8_9BACT|nr:DUF1264 domain-containing protein [Chryseosolibacter indicus]MBT1703826.1 DUF1264 domain-containing protein [Chryseosolibacter indicus]